MITASSKPQVHLISHGINVDIILRFYYCTYSNLFGLPLPGLPTTPDVASLTMVEGTLPALTPLARRRAAAPVVNFTKDHTNLEIKEKWQTPSSTIR